MQNLGIQAAGLLEPGPRGVRIVAMQQHIAQVSVGLRMRGIVGQLLAELALRFVIAALFPHEIAQSEMNFRLLRRSGGGGLKLGDGIGIAPQTVESLAHKHVGRGRIGLFF